MQIVADNDVEKKLNSVVFWFLKRFLSAVLIAAIILCAMYFSLVQSAEPLVAAQHSKVQTAIDILAEKGFDREVFLLRRTVVFRASDNWLNSTAGHENAYAATNFPFQIVTLYEGFFTRTDDDTERAMILLHEAQHLQGASEAGAYETVWRSRKKLGWTRDSYGGTRVWQNVLEATKQNAPQLFRCEFNQSADCTE